MLHWRQFLLDSDARSVSGAVVNKCEGGMCSLLRVGPREDMTVLVTSKDLASPPEVKLLKADASVQDLHPTRGKPDLYRVNLGDQKVELNISRPSLSRLDMTVSGISEKPAVLHYYADRDLVTTGDSASLMRGGSKVRVGRSHGYGVFAAQSIRKGEVVEEAPLLSQTTPFLTDYTFTTGGKYVLPLGNIPLYNHSDDPSCDHVVNDDATVLTLVSRRPIKLGEELSINYGPQWFSARGMELKALA